MIATASDENVEIAAYPKYRYTPPKKQHRSFLMSEKLVIVVGDRTTHSGTVITGNPSVEISNKLAACLGDKVMCPQHGETEITEGYTPLTLQPNRTLAYHGCKTSCGATLIGGGQGIVFVDVGEDAQTTLACIEDPTDKNDEEFALFVATVWGKAANQSEIGWQAVGSVIMNRVGHPYWASLHRNKSVTSVIKLTGFDAARGKKNVEFKKAYQYLTLKNNSPTELTQHEKSLINKMKTLLKPIYYKNQVTTNANHYYSPKEQLRQYQKEFKESPEHIIHPAVPKWAKTLERSNVSGLSSNDDLSFFYKSR